MRARGQAAIGALGLVIGLWTSAVAAQAPATLNGTLRTGTPGEIPYEVITPTTWNGTLVLDLDFITSWNPTLRQWFLDHGYAVGGTRRLQNVAAYQIRDYVDNFITIRNLLIERTGARPARTALTY